MPPRSDSPRFALQGSIFAGISVALGAFAAHALKSHLDAYAQGIWETAVRYQFWHALGLLALDALLARYPTPRAERLLRVAGRAFGLGIVLFSGSLYVLALTGVKRWGMVTPFGGVAFLIGWGAVALAVGRRDDGGVH